MKNLLLLLFLISGACFSQEICNNAIDDDNDALTDLNDPDCTCNQTVVSSVIPNPSFETFSGCPTWDGPLVATGWIEANQLSPDYINPADCNFLGNSVPFPFPDGNGIIGQIVGGGTEFIGSCLLNTLEAGVTYQLTFNIAVDSGLNSCITPFDPIDLTLYGSGNCADMPLPQFVQPNSSTPFIVLGSAYYLPVNQWGQLTIAFTPPIDINGVILGSPEFTTDTYNVSINQCRPYFLYDNLILNKSSLFAVNVTASGNYCEGTLVLTAHPEIPISGSAVYQWYDDGVAIIGAAGSSYLISSNGSGIGNYSVKITDGINCFISPRYTVSGTMPGPDTMVVAPTCSTNGSITVTTAADEYSFDGGSTWTTNPVKSNLAPGTYSVKIRYRSGCVSGSAAVNLPVPVYLPAPLYTTINAVCGATGSITVTTTAVQFSFDNGLSWGTTPQLLNINDGLYSVKIKDSSGCISDAAHVTVGRDFLASPTYTSINPGCTNIGEIHITTPAAEYSFDGGITWSLSPDLTNLSPGYYQLAIKNTQGCISDNVPVSFTNTIATPLYTYVVPGCNAQGSITVTTSGATAYSFDGGLSWQSGPTTSNLAAGIYGIAYKDVNSCISPIAQLTLYDTFLNFYPQFTVVPSGCDLGSITITTVAALYSCDNGINWQASPLFNNLQAGNYSLVVKDASGCKSFTKPAIVTHVAASLPDPFYQVVPSDCNGNGSITITSPASQYSFDSGLTWRNSNVQLALTAGNYNIKIKSSNGCESNSVVVNVPIATVNPPITLPINYCLYTAALPLTATGINLLWYMSTIGGNGNSSAPIPSTAIVGSTTWYVSQTINGCESARTPLDVNVFPVPAPPLAIAEVSYCQNEPSAQLTATGTNLLWYTAPSGGTANTIAPIPSTATAGIYRYYVSQSIGTCESDRTEIKIIIKPTPSAPLTQNLIYYDLNSPAQQLSAIGTQLLWYDHNRLQLAEAPVPLTNISGTLVYYVSQIVDGCESPLTAINIIVAPLYMEIGYPVFFTPNEDGYNDTWNIYPPANNVIATVYIFDRYGKLLKQIHSNERGWDGTYNRHDLPASDYWFLVKYSEFDLQKEYRSHFTLKR